MDPRHCGAAIALLLTAICSSSSGSAQDRFGATVSVTLVEVPVQVTLRGKPLTGLTRDDFELLEDGDVRPLESFETIDHRAHEGRRERRNPKPATLAQEPRSGRRRHLVLLVDLSAPRHFLARALSGLRRMVRRQLEPSDLAVVALSSPAGTRLLWGFSADQDLLLLQLDLLEDLLDAEPLRAADTLAAMERAQGGPSAPFSVADLRALAPHTSPPPVLDFLTGGPPTVDGGGALQRSGSNRLDPEITPLDPTSEDLAEIEDPRIVKALASEQRRYDGLAELATVLRDVPAPKHMVFFSGRGASALLASQVSRSRLASSLWELTATLSSTGWTVHTVDVEGVPATTHSGANVHTGPEEITAGARSRVMGLQPGQQPARTGFNAETLLTLSADTGGLIYENFNTLSEVTRRLLDSTAVSYLLAFRPAPGKPPGRYRRIDVRLRDAPPSVEIHHRPGYLLADPR